MNKNDEWLQKIHNGCNKVTSTGYALLEIANALEMGGNMLLADKLNRYSEWLIEASKQIGNATGECISEQIKMRY